MSESELRAQPFVAAALLPWDARAWPLGEGPSEFTRLDEVQRTQLIHAADELFAEPSRTVISEMAALVTKLISG